MASFQGITQDSARGHGENKSRNFFQPLLGFRSPFDALFRFHFNRRLEHLAGKIHIARHQPEKIFRIPADVHVRCAVYANPAQNQHVGIFFPGILQYFLENLSIQQTDGTFQTLILDEFSGYLKMSLINLRQTFIDDVLMQFFLLLKLEDFSRFLGQDSGETVEHGVMKIGIESRNNFQRPIEMFGHFDSGFQSTVGVTTAIDGDDDFAAGGFILMQSRNMFDYQGIGLNPANDPLGDRTDLAVSDCAQTQCAQNHQIVIGLLDIANQFDPVPSFQRFTHKRNLGLLAPRLRHFEIRIGNDLHAFGDQLIVDIALFFQFLLILILFRQATLHLPKPDIVHFRRVNMARGDGGLAGGLVGRLARFGKLQGKINTGI